MRKQQVFVKTLKKCPDAESHQDLTPGPPDSPKMVLIHSTFIRKTKHSFECCHLLKERWPSPTLFLPIKKATTLLWEAGREDTAWRWRLLLLLKKFFLTDSASVFSLVKRDHGYHVSCVAQLLAQKKRQSTNVCWTVAALRWLKACLLVLYRSFSLKFVSTFEKMLKLQLLNNRLVGRLAG